MFLEYLGLFFMLVLLCVFVCAVICMPVMIANSRGIEGSQKTIIAVLSWLGLLFGITWLVALILSLVWQGDCNQCQSCQACGSRLDELEKLAKLYKSKVISKAEYEKLKKNLLKD